MGWEKSVSEQHGWLQSFVVMVVVCGFSKV